MWQAAVIKYLPLLDIAVEKQSGIPPAVAMSRTTPSENGQTLHHLVVILEVRCTNQGFARAQFDLDVRDRNKYTALHLAVMARSEERAPVVVQIRGGVLMDSDIHLVSLL